VSDPFPQTAYVDVAKSILLDVRIQDNGQSAEACTSSIYMAMSADVQLDAELRTPAKTFGGAVGNNFINWLFANPTAKRPTDPRATARATSGSRPRWVSSTKGPC